MKTLFGRRLILTGENTSPFMLAAIIYCIFLSLPFLYFLFLRGNYYNDFEDEETPEEVVAADTVVAPMEQIKFDTVLSLRGDTLIVPNKLSKEFNIVNGEEEVTEAGEYGSGYLSNGQVIYENDEWKNDKESAEFIVLTRLAIFSAVLCFGALGAGVSLISRARNKNEIIGNVSAVELISIQTVGAIFALLLALIFMGELIGGTLFPNADTFYYVIYIPAAFAKLLVWSFLAGFSERLVPNILVNILEKAEDIGNGGPGPKAGLKGNINGGKNGDILVSTKTEETTVQTTLPDNGNPDSNTDTGEDAKTD